MKSVFFFFKKIIVVDNISEILKQIFLKEIWLVHFGQKYLVIGYSLAISRYMLASQSVPKVHFSQKHLNSTCWAPMTLRKGILGQSDGFSRSTHEKVKSLHLRCDKAVIRKHCVGLPKAVCNLALFLHQCVPAGHYN